ncbi:glycoside hydrolase, partial [Dendryphion nanum]
TILLTSGFAAQVLAHGILTEFTANGVRYEGFATESIYKIQNGNPVPDVAAWSTEALDRGYIEPNSMSTQDINCHKNAAPGVLTAEVAAGGTIDFFWADWPHNQSPVLTYIAPCNGDCATVDKSTLEWIKIDEAGWDGEWAGQKLMNNNFTWTTTVPSTIAAGNYVFRNEIINLHSGVKPNGAQLYPQCMNVKITGSGTDRPKGTLAVNFYKPDDAGILFDGASKNIIEYPIPGPPLYIPGDTA